LRKSISPPGIVLANLRDGLAQAAQRGLLVRGVAAVRRSASANAWAESAGAAKGKTALPVISDHGAGRPKQQISFSYCPGCCGVSALCWQETLAWPLSARDAKDRIGRVFDLFGLARGRRHIDGGRWRVDELYGDAST